MRWLNMFSGKKPGLLQIRKGMWVVDEIGAVGILVELAGSGEAQVHMVDAAGFTTRVVNLQVAKLRQARFEQIPAPRRPSKQVGNRLGYV